MSTKDDQAFTAALDAWISERAKSLANPATLDREEAIRILAAEALTSMGLLRPGGSS